MTGHQWAGLCISLGAYLAPAVVIALHLDEMNQSTRWGVASVFCVMATTALLMALLK